MNVVASFRYARQRQIGVGEGMNSKVFLAYDPQLGGEVAVKEIPKMNLANEDYFVEAQAMFKSSHPHVADVKCACQSDDDVIIVMPHYANGSLESKLKTGPLSLKQLIDTGREVLLGLNHIHTQGYLHFDLKPSNILFSEHGRAHISDFGQSRQIRDDGTVLVPRAYLWAMPPETVAKSAATIHADIYQVGLLLYRAVNGDIIFDDEQSRLKGLLVTDYARFTREIERGRFPNRSLFLPHVPEGLRRVIRKALSTDPATRYRGAGEFSAALAAVALPLNWTIKSCERTGIEWVASRPTQPQLVVKLSVVNDSHSAQIYTINNGSHRAREKSSWFSDLDQKAAYSKLADIFRRLS